MILVVGATGNVGRHVVAELSSQGAAVRALARRPAAGSLPDGVEVRRGDLADLPSVEAALDGVDAVFLLWPLMTTDEVPDVLRAVGAEARHIVYLSSMGILDDLERQADPITQSHADIERLIRRSGLTWTFLRSGGMATNTLGWAAQIKADDTVRWPHAGLVRSLIHEHDLAAVAARALVDDAYHGRTLRLTGPEALSQSDQASIIGETIERPVRFQEVEPAVVREQMLAEGWPTDVVDGMLGAWAQMAVEPEPVLPTVEEVTGTPGRTFREWTVDHADSFR